MLYFVENLTWHTWAFSICPRLFKARLHAGRADAICYVIDGSRFAMLIARAMASLTGTAVHRFPFHIADVHDESGLSSSLLILFQDLAQVQQRALEEPAFKELLRNGSLEGRLPVFLAKRLASTQAADRSTIFQALLVVQVCSWKSRQNEAQSGATVLFLGRRPWLGAIISYASEHGVTIVPVPAAVNIRSALQRRLPRRILDVLRRARYRRLQRRMARQAQDKGLPGSLGRRSDGLSPQLKTLDRTQAESRPRVGIEYYGMLNLNHPERHSDLFFWQQSSLAGSDLLLTFSIPSYPLDARGLCEITEHGLGAVVLHPGATTLPGVPVFRHRQRVSVPRGTGAPAAQKGPIGSWLKQQTAAYHDIRAYWTDLASTYNIKVYVTWYKYDATHCAIADAMQSLGAITAIYQRAYEAHPSAQTTLAADVVFGYSQRVADVERGSNSSIRYHVTTGYLGDHRSPLLRESAKLVRDELQRHGARHILAYFDENSVDDARWYTGHHVPQDDYAFLLKRVLAEPSLGLVIKPKVPGTLRKRLGPVADLLARAQATGRCYVYEADRIAPNQGWHPPVEAALAADIAIHGFLASATAGMEAALAGVPTLLLDLDGWPLSPLYALGIGTVVFTDWETLWEGCKHHWSSPGGIT